MWDEVEVKYRWCPDTLQQSRKATTAPTLVQRGVIAFTLGQEDNGGTTLAHLADAWLGPPQEAAGTSAAALAPGLRKFWPRAFQFLDPAALQRLTAAGKTATFMPMCDKASGNLLLYKYWGWFWENNLLADGALEGRILFFPDVCCVHLHHRAKLQVRGLRVHTLRHFSVANLLRIKGVQAHVLGRLEALVNERLQRVTQAPPANDHMVSMWHIADILFKLDDPRHDRNHGRK